jgi:hypothetical protein
VAKQGIKKMHRLQYFKSDPQVEVEENETIFKSEKSKGHQNKIKTHESK